MNEVSTGIARDDEWKVCLVLEYEGTQYAGFQSQGDKPTVQTAVEEAFFRLTGERRRLAAAGRTDTGVHATGQVVTFRTSSRVPVERFVNGMNFHLPEDIAVRAARRVDMGFDPRRDARSRTYRYTMLNSQGRSPLLRRTSYRVAQPLNVDAMEEAAGRLVGEHDFRAFAMASGGEASTLRRGESARVWREGDLVLFEIEASGFLRQQVRRTAGSLVRVGTGDLTVDAFGSMLCTPEPGAASWALPPEGLCLVSVRYDDPTMK